MRKESVEASVSIETGDVLPKVAITVSDAYRSMSHRMCLARAKALLVQLSQAIRTAEGKAKA